MSRIQKSIAKWFGAFLLLFCSFSYSNAQAPVVTNPTFYDDTNVHVPLQFGFPFYGRTFTNSWMHSNGVVSFLDPAVPVPGAGYNPAQWAYCCQGMQPSATRPEFSFMIAPLWTDLYPVASSTFSTEGTTTYQRYYWNNIAEISNMNNLNTFSLEIRPTGFIGVNYDKINIQNQQTWSGIIGDPALNQWTERFYGVPGLNAHLSAIPNWSVNSTPGDMCAINPLSSPTCPGYTEAMCSSNPLYSTSCAGYQQAYFTQQCSANALYNVNCPGYAAAYLTYQCSINPLYSTTCEGYQQAYFDQQCSLNGLYSTSCPNYQSAYFTQQCSLNGLYSTQCPNYAEAYATKQALDASKTNTSTTTTVVTTTTTSDPTKVSVVSDPVVNNVVTSTATSTSPATAATATVPLVQSNTTTSSTSVTTAAIVREEKKQEEKTDAASTSTTSSSNNQTASSQESKPSGDQPKTARQELQERRVAAARAQAVEAGKNLADNVGKAANIEQQIAVQNVVVAAMGFVPGFDAYNKAMIPDGAGYKPFTIYNNQRNIDNPAGRRFMTGSDRLHNEMVDAQYNR